MSNEELLSMYKEKKKTMRREIHNSEYYNTIKKIFFLLSDEWNKRSERAIMSVTKNKSSICFFKDTEKHTKNNS